MKDIVIVYGRIAIPERGALKIAEHFDMNCVRQGRGEWPCPISLREGQRVLYIQEEVDIEWLARILIEGYTPTVIHFDNLPVIPGLPCERCGRTTSHPEGWHYCSVEGKDDVRAH